MVFQTGRKQRERGCGGPQREERGRGTQQREGEIKRRARPLKKKRQPQPIRSPAHSVLPTISDASLLATALQTTTRGATRAERTDLVVATVCFCMRRAIFAAAAAVCGEKDVFVFVCVRAEGETVLKRGRVTHLSHRADPARGPVVLLVRTTPKIEKIRFQVV
jgi:hypothetical protein